MHKLQPRERRILAMTLGFLGLLALDQVVVAPLAASWERLDKAVIKKQEQLAHDQRLLAERKNIQRQYAAYAVSQRESGDGSRAEGITRLLKEIESLARANNVKISDVRPQSAGRSASGTSISLSVDAGWESLVRFLYQLQRSTELLQIEKASILRKNDETSQLNGRFVITRSDEI